MTAAEVLRRAAEAYRNGEISWGREVFIDEDGCRCALGAIAWAASTDDKEGDPIYAGPESEEAARVLSRYLVDVIGSGGALDMHGELEPIETVGQWNDYQPDVSNVIAALEAASERAA